MWILRTYLEFREADLTSDGKFNIYASYIENQKIQPFEQTSIRGGGDLEMKKTASNELDRTASESKDP